MHGKINAKSKMFSSGIDTFQNRESHKGNFTIKIIVCSLKIILKKKHVMYTTQMSPTQLKIHGCIILYTFALAGSVHVRVYIRRRVKTEFHVAALSGLHQEHCKLNEP